MRKWTSFAPWGVLLATAGWSMQAPQGGDPWDVIIAVSRNRSMQFHESLTLGRLRSATSAQLNQASQNNGAFLDPACLAQKGSAVDPELTPKTTGNGYLTTFHGGPRSAAACGVTAFAYLAVPEKQGDTGLRAFCTDDTREVRASVAAALPVIRGGRCPASWALEAAVPFAPPPISEADRRAALKALDDDPRAAKVDSGTKETFRAMLADEAHAATPPAGRAHAKGVTALAFTPDGRFLVSGGLENPEIKLWSLPQARLSRTLPGMCDGVMYMLVAPDANTLVASCGDMSVKLVSLVTGKVIRNLGDYDTVMVSLSATGDGRTVLTSAKGKATFVTLPAGIRGQARDIGGRMMTVGAVSRDGTMAAAGSMDVPVSLWSLPAGQPRGTLDATRGTATDLVFSPDGRFLAAGFENGGVSLWDTAKRHEVWARREHGFIVNRVAFTPDGQWLLSASSDHTLKVWSIPLGEVRTTLRGDDDEVLSLAVSADGRTVASGDSAGVVRLWDLESGSSRMLADPAVR